jgi:phosphoglucosamine mutase
VEVIKFATEPDGLNINADCGATHTGPMCELVRKHKADIGISLDGDSDRVIFSDAAGNVVNGDRILGLCALNFKSRGRLSNNTLVVTSMSNLGLIKAMNENGIKVEVTSVGDRYVIECMKEGDFNLGGEQSGHLIFLDYATTGDGIISALHILKLMKDSGKSLAEMANFMEEYPQKLSSFAVKEKKPLDKVPSLHQAIKEAEKALGSDGRVNVRYSGTENKMRILVEAKSAEAVESWTAKRVGLAKKELC